jgi:hypothetical protein
MESLSKKLCAAYRIGASRPTFCTKNEPEGYAVKKRPSLIRARHYPRSRIYGVIFSYFLPTKNKKIHDKKDREKFGRPRRQKLAWMLQGMG